MSIRRNNLLGVLAVAPLFLFTWCVANAAAFDSKNLERAVGTAALVVKGRVRQIAAKCTVISCSERKFRIETEEVFFRRDRSTRDSEISVIVLCVNADLALGSDYVFFLNKEPISIADQSNDEGGPESINQDTRCPYSAERDSTFFVGKNGYYYGLIDPASDYSLDESNLVMGVRAANLGHFLESLSKREASRTEERK